MPPVDYTLGSDFDGFNITMLQGTVKQLPPTCCRFCFIIVEKIMPATCSTGRKIILKNIAVDFIWIAVKNNKQVWDVVIVDNNPKSGNSRGINCYCQVFCLLGGGDVVNGCGAHRSGVVDFYSIGPGEGHPWQDAPLFTNRYTVTNCSLSCFLTLAFARAYLPHSDPAGWVL